MKRFYYTDRPDTRSRHGDRDIRVYKMKNGIMEQVAAVSYRPGSTRGAQSEAYNALIEAGYIPRKWYSQSRSSRSGEGYFLGPVTEHYSIQEIY